MRARNPVRPFALAAALLLGCATPRTPPPVVPPPTPEPPAAAVPVHPDTFPRPAVRPLPVPQEFEAAVLAGTRAPDGRPGPGYWRQGIAYQIDAELDPRTNRVQAEELVVYRNRSRDTLDMLVFNVYQNLFTEEMAGSSELPVTGGIRLERVVVGSRGARRLQSGAPPAAGAFQVDGTIMRLHLPRPLAPGDSVRVGVTWSFEVPRRGAPRTGRIGQYLYNVAQWYPQIAMYDDLRGWDTAQYVGDAEFYLPYADFDFSITLPEGWLIGATGTLQNPEEVLTEEIRARLRSALAGEQVVRVVRPGELEAGVVTVQQPGGALTWRFRAREVRDIAFAASSRYVWDATAAQVDRDGDGDLETVAIHALYRPEAGSWRQAAEFLRHAVEFFSEELAPFPYPHMTAAEGPVGGMEYPMITFVGAYTNDPPALYQTLAHETAHVWFPMLVGSDERRHAWMDEGFSTYIENLAIADRFPEFPAFERDWRSYARIAGRQTEEPMMQSVEQYRSYLSFAVASYMKPALALRALEAAIGPDALRAALRTYISRWADRNPTPYDFFNTVEDVAGRDLDWFWTSFWYGTGVLDQAVSDVTVAGAGAGGDRVLITVEDQGDVPMPVPLAVTDQAGEVTRIEVPVDVWLAGYRRHTIELEVPGGIREVAIDPEELLPDVDRGDNTWRRQDR